MTTLNKLLVLLLILSLVIGIMVSIFIISRSGKPAHERPLVVGVLVGPEYQNQADIIKAAAKEAAEEDGRGKIVTVQIKEATKESYREAFKKLVSTRVQDEKVMGLVITGNPNFDLTEEIRGLSLKGKPIIVMGQDYPKSLRDIFVSTDNTQTGRALGKAVASERGVSRKIVAIVTGPESNKKQDQIMKGLRHELNQYANISVLKIIHHETNEQTAKDLKTLFAQTPHLYALISTGPWIFDSNVIGSLAENKGKVFAAANTPEALTAMQANKAAALLIEDTYKNTFDAANYCFLRLRSVCITQPAPQKSILVTKENIHGIMKKWGKEPLQSTENKKQAPTKKLNYSCEP